MNIDYHALLPVEYLASSILVVLVVDLFLPARAKSVSMWVAMVGVLVRQRVEAGVVAERAFGAQFAQLDIAFEHDLGIRRHFEVARLALHHLDRTLPRRKPAIIISSRSGGSGRMAEYMVAGSAPIATATSIRFRPWCCMRR